MRKFEYMSQQSINLLKINEKHAILKYPTIKYRAARKKCLLFINIFESVLQGKDFSFATLAKHFKCFSSIYNKFLKPTPVV